MREYELQIFSWFLWFRTSDVVVAQKYGQGYDVFCDTALVYGENTTYIVAIFTESHAKDVDRVFIKNLANELHKIVDK